MTRKDLKFLPAKALKKKFWSAGNVDQIVSKNHTCFWGHDHHGKKLGYERHE